MIENDVGDYDLTEDCDIKALPSINSDFTDWDKVLDYYGPAFFEKSVLDWVKVQELNLELLGITSRNRQTSENSVSNDE